MVVDAVPKFGRVRPGDFSVEPDYRRFGGGEGRGHRAGGCSARTDDGNW
jgi:hypothetical protein